MQPASQNCKLTDMHVRVLQLCMPAGLVSKLFGQHSSASGYHARCQNVLFLTCLLLRLPYL